MTKPEHPSESGPTGPIPDDNRVGHHPLHEQDKPDTDRFVERFDRVEVPQVDRPTTDEAAAHDAIESPEQAGQDHRRIGTTTLHLCRLAIDGVAALIETSGEILSGAGRLLRRSLGTGHNSG